MILDIAYVVMFLLAILVGYKVGFLRYILKIASLLAGLISSVLLVNPVKKLVMSTALGDKVVDMVVAKFHETEIYQNLGENATIQELLGEIGIPDVLVGAIEVILNNMGIIDGEVVNSLSVNIANIIVTFLAFIFLWLGTALLFKILKLLTNTIRTAKFVKVIDGVVGVVLSVFIYFISSFTIVAVTDFARGIDAVEQSIGPWMDEQLDSSIGVYKFYYEHNMIIEFVEMFKSKNLNITKDVDNKNEIIVYFEIHE